MQISIILIHKMYRNGKKTKSKIYYARTDEFWTKEQKFQHLDRVQSAVNVEWQEVAPDEKHTWLTTGLEGEFDSFLAIGNKETKEGSAISSIFNSYSRGLETARDDWVYNFSKDCLTKNVQLFINVYDEQLHKWQNRKVKSDLDSFVLSDNKRIKWSSRLKENLEAGESANFEVDHVRQSLYRPFTSQYLYFDKVLNHRRGQFPLIYPTSESEQENRIICLAGVGDRKGFGCLASRFIAALDFAFEKAQCFSFHTYNEDGTNRRENITDWGLTQFCSHYNDDLISKWDIFHYVYAILHHPHYRDRYAANLKRELPRIPLVPYAGTDAQPTEYTDKPVDLFWLLAKAGVRLAEIHVHYEDQPEYPLKEIESPGEPLNLRVEKMRLSKDKTQIKYNDFLTLSGIPPETFRYRLGNRSALDWIIDQYQIKTDKRSGITNDPNQLEDEGYIVSLIKKVITVSVETVAIIEGLPNIGLPKDLPKDIE